MQEQWEVAIACQSWRIESTDVGRCIVGQVTSSKDTLICSCSSLLFEIRVNFLTLPVLLTVLSTSLTLLWEIYTQGNPFSTRAVTSFSLLTNIFLAQACDMHSDHTVRKYMN
jgi:hypothetical protein